MISDITKLDKICNLKNRPENYYFPSFKCLKLNSNATFIISHSIIDEFYSLIYF